MRISSVKQKGTVTITIIRHALDGQTKETQVLKDLLPGSVQSFANSSDDAVSGEERLGGIGIEKDVTAGCMYHHIDPTF